jgi:hypothetical protein
MFARSVFGAKGMDEQGRLLNRVFDKDVDEILRFVDAWFFLFCDYTPLSQNRSSVMFVWPDNILLTADQ